MKINHIEKVTKFVSVEGEESRLAIFIEYNEKKMFGNVLNFIIIKMK